MKIAAMLRVKNEARWIGKVIDSIAPLCAGSSWNMIHVLDDHSTDSTMDICRSRNVHVYPSKFDGINETRDKNWLLEQIMSNCNPDWVLHIDGDEELEPASIDAILTAIHSGAAPSYSLQVLYLWNNEHTIRTDGIYADYRRESLFSAKDTDGIFSPMLHGKGTKANFHCTNVPADLVPKSIPCNARLLHYGYIDRAVRLEKYDFYNSMDPNNQLEDRYRHIVAGDIPEVPAHVKTKWGGPLTLKPFTPLSNYPLKLNLGANDRCLPGFLSVDIVPPADFIADLTKPWPWADSTVDEVAAFDVFEHLPDKRHTMNELWRVLKPGSRVTIQVPHATDGDGGHCDPTHVSYWTTSDFEYYVQGIPERERFRNSTYYRVKADFKMVSIKTVKHPRTYGGYVVEIQAILETIKQLAPVPVTTANRVDRVDVLEVVNA